MLLDQEVNKEEPKGQKYGFQALTEPLLKTEHYACDVWYQKKLGGNQ